MDFEKVLSLRQAVRAYTDEPVSEEQLKAILNAAYRAPVGMHNFAGYHLTVITRPELLLLWWIQPERSQEKIIIRCMGHLLLSL